MVLTTKLIAGLLVLVLAFACGGETPDERAQRLVNDAIERYERDGEEAAVAHYNDPAHVDGQWYVFIVGRDQHNLAHYRPERIGLDVRTMTDTRGYAYGPEVLATTSEGSWVSYWFLNPDTGEEQQKRTWVVEHDGLIFGSGWYE